MELRMCVLKDYSTYYDAACLLRTSLWEPNLFPKAAVASLGIQKVNNIPRMLGLTKPNTYRFKNSYVPASKWGVRNYSRKYQFSNRSDKPKQASQQPFQGKKQQYTGNKQDAGKFRQQNNSTSKPSETKNSQQNNKAKQYRPNVSAKANNNKKQK